MSLSRRAFFIRCSGAAAVALGLPGLSNIITPLSKAGSPAAFTLPFGTLPHDLYIKGHSYFILMDRIPLQGVSHESRPT